jgi:hypothetical protein
VVPTSLKRAANFPVIGCSSTKRSPFETLLFFPSQEVPALWNTYMSNPNVFRMSAAVRELSSHSQDYATRNDGSAFKYKPNEAMM